MEKIVVKRQNLPLYIFYALCGYALFSAVSITLAEVFFVSGLLLWIFDAGLNKTGVKKYFMLFVALPFAAFALWHLLCVFTGLDISDSLKDWKKVYLFLMVFLAASYVPRDERHTRLITGAYICGIVFISIYAIVTTLISKDPAFRPASFSGNHMHLGGMLMMGFVVCLSLLGGVYKERKTDLRRLLLFGAALLLIGAALIMTKTRGSWLGAAAGFIVVSLMVERRLLIAAVLAGVIIFFTAQDNEYIERLKNITRVHKGTSSIERVYMWRSGLEMIKDRPVFGIGTANVGKAYPAYKNPEAMEPNAGHLHNNLIQVAVIDGIPGLLFFLWIFYALFLAQSGALLKDRGNVLLQAGFAAGVAFFINGFFEYNFFSSQVALMFWFITGLSLAQVKAGENEKN